MIEPPQAPRDNFEYVVPRVRPPVRVIDCAKGDPHLVKLASDTRQVERQCSHRFGAIPETRDLISPKTQPEQVRFLIFYPHLFYKSSGDGIRIANITDCRHIPQVKYLVHYLVGKQKSDPIRMGLIRFGVRHSDLRPIGFWPLGVSPRPPSISPGKVGPTLPPQLWWHSGILPGSPCCHCVVAECDTTPNGHLIRAH